MPRLIRLLVSVAILGFIAREFGAGIVDQLRGIEPGWLFAGLLLSVIQILLSAWRWRFTAARLALPLAPMTAVREYYLASLVNQILPGGVLGDAQRAWRHGRATPRRAPAFQAVVIERFSGQLAMIAMAVTVWLIWPPRSNPAFFEPSALEAGGIAGALLAIGAGAIIASGWRPAWLADWWQALRCCLLTQRVLAVQLITSALVAASTIAVYACCVAALAPAGTDPAAFVRAAFAFLLERESKSDILASFDINVIKLYFPNFERDIGSYL